jgi:triacylglycerol esterase/lipase EstA (alpha/beta hydrolase family)
MGPLENAEMLAQQLRTLNPARLAGRKLDIITHRRGGLVARSLCELAKESDAVRNLIFIDTPNCGTDMANPQNLGRMADPLVNLTGVDHAALYGKLAGLLANLAVQQLWERVPGAIA